MKDSRCQFCGDSIGLGREFVFQVEDADFEHLYSHDPDLLQLIRNSAEYYGEPLRVCENCHREIEENANSLDVEIAEQSGFLRPFLIFLAGVGIVFLALMFWACLRRFLR